MICHCPAVRQCCMMVTLTEEMFFHIPARKNMSSRRAVGYSQWMPCDVFPFEVSQSSSPAAQRVAVRLLKIHLLSQSAAGALRFCGEEMFSTNALTRVFLCPTQLQNHTATFPVCESATRSRLNACLVSNACFSLCTGFGCKCLFPGPINASALYSVLLCSSAPAT